MILKSKKVKFLAIFAIAILLFFVFVPPLTRKWYRDHSVRYAPPVPANKWKEFLSSEGTFSVWFPGIPEETNQLFISPIGSVKQHIFYVNPDIQDGYIVGYSDSEKFNETVRSGKATQFLKTAESRVVKEEEGKVLFEQETMFGNYPAREFEYKAGGKANYAVRVKYIMVGPRLYCISAVF